MKRSMIIVAALCVAALLALSATPASAQKTMKIGMVAFLTGAAAGPFGIPAKEGSELIVDAINNGSMPSPYNTRGIGGANLEAVYIDESGGTAKQVEEFRNLVQRQNVDAVTGYISSGSCLAIAPVAEELKMLTVLNICGTPRIFEDGSYKYVFRTKSHSTMDNVAAAYFVKERFPNIKTYAGINQNYAWGQDSWRDFDATMQLIMPGTKPVTTQWPKLFAGQYSGEISALQRSRAQVIHSSFWDGDLESFINQATARGLHKRAHLIYTAGENSMFRLGRRLPDGTIMGARGPYGLYAHDTELNRWFRSNYEKKYGAPPVYSAYMGAQAILALKIGYDKAAAANGGQFPSREQAIAQMEGMKFEAFGTTIDLALGNGHQARTETAYGIYRYDKAKGQATVTDVVRFDAECVNPPPGMNSVDWIKGGMKGAKCN